MGGRLLPFHHSRKSTSQVDRIFMPAGDMRKARPKHPGGGDAAGGEVSGRHILESST